MDALTYIIEAALARLFPLYDEVTLGALIGFGKSDIVQPMIYAIIGASMMSALLFLFGRFLAQFAPMQTRIAAVKLRAKRLLFPLLFIAPLTPFCSPILIGVGLFGISATRSILAILFAEILYRAVMIWG